MIKGIIFDLDHTLFDRYATMRAALPIMYKKLGEFIPHTLSQEKFISGVINGDKKYIHLNWEVALEKLIENNVFLPNITCKTFIDCLENDCWPTAAVNFPFIDDTLEALKSKGYKLGIITNGNLATQKRKVDMLGIGHYFDEIVFCGALEQQKPHLLPFEEMSSRIGISAKELMYVGDHPLNDVAASQKAGYTPVWVRTTGYWIFSEIKHPEFEVDTIAEIPYLLERI